MEFATAPAPHLAPGSDVGRLMRDVLLALLPGIAAHVWLFGWGVVVQIAIASAAALAAEAAVLALRRRSVRHALGDLSALVTAWLLALALPPLVPWWLTVTGAVFAIVIVKQLFGGLGGNLFNPAMAGYAALLISFPQPMTRWLAPAPPAGIDLASALRIVWQGAVPPDGLTMATPLDVFRTGLTLVRDPRALVDPGLATTLPGSGWEWVAAGFALGGLWLLARGVIRWHIPVAMLLTLTVLASVFHLLDAARYAPPQLHLLAGAAVLGAFFVATDPVTAASSGRGRLLFGAGAGLLTYVIRTWGGYPDGVAFAVLLMNLAAPTIDRFTAPALYGSGGGRGP